METNNNSVHEPKANASSKVISTMESILKTILKSVEYSLRPIGYMFNSEAYGTTIRSRWMYYFDDMKYSTKEFYEITKNAILARGLPGVLVRTISLPEGGWYSPQRLYLRIYRHDYFFDICAAPYGNGFFISYWLGSFPNTLARLLGIIPIIGKRLSSWVTPRRTYFRVDTESMFLESVRTSVMEAIDAITTEQGCRKTPNQLERMPKDFNSSTIGA